MLSLHASTMFALLVWATWGRLPWLLISARPLRGESCGDEVFAAQAEGKPRIIRLLNRHEPRSFKTIGDGFMAAAGLLHEINDPIGSAIRCGLEMASTLVDSNLGWEVRAGVHAGPVVAGVVGQERYQFDIWGDTVNTSARMVDMGAPGSVAVTQEIWEQVSSVFHGEALGEINVKGKGRVAVFSLRLP